MKRMDEGGLPHVRPGVDVSRVPEAGAFEAALNLMREQQRAVLDVRRQIMSDAELKAEDPVHHHRLLVQTLAEVGQLGAAIRTLEAVEAGRIVVVPDEPVGPRVKAADLPATERTSGLALKPPCAPLGAWS